MAGVAGCQINFDKGEANIEGQWIDDIRSCCTELDIHFETTGKLWFTDDSQCYFTFRGVDWVPASVKEYVTQNNTYNYSLQAFPKFFFDFITKASKDTRALVSSFGAQTTEEFDNLELPCPVKNRYAIEMMKDYRLQFFQEAYKKKDMSEAVLLYMCGSKVLSMKFGRWMNKDALPLETTNYQSSTSPVNFYNSQISDELLCDRRVAPFKPGDYLQRMIGRTFEITGSAAFIFLGRYTLRLAASDGSEFDSNETYMCLRCVENIGKPDEFSSVFSEIKYVGK